MFAAHHVYNVVGLSMQAMKAVLMISSSERVVALGPGSDVGRELSALVELLDNLDKDVGPSREHVDKHTPFFKQLIHVVGDFYSKDVATSTGGVESVTTLYGGEALQAQFREVAPS